MTRNELIALLDKKAAAFQMTGSRYICSPAPTTTDEDYIALMPPGMEMALEVAGFETTTDPDKYADLPQFISFRRGEFNVIVTNDKDFYSLFVEATEKAKSLNLLNKADRISLFRSIIYGEVELCEIPL